MSTRSVFVRVASILILGGLTACNDFELVSLPPPPGGEEIPVAVISGAASDYQTLETVHLDGTASYDPDNPAPDAIAEYRWSLIAVPAGSSTQPTPLAHGALADIFLDVAGTYTVALTVVDRAGLVSEPDTFTFDVAPWADIHAELSWTTNGSDVDVHLLSDSRGGSLFDNVYDCYFGNMTPEWGAPGPIGNATLDIDDVDGYGPENINVGAPEDGQSYRIVVHYWDDWGTGPTDATLRLYVAGTLVFEDTRMLAGTDRTWEVLRIDWPSQNVQVLGQMYDLAW